MKQKIRKTFQMKKNKKIHDNLVELVNKLNKKEKYRYHDRDDFDYHGIRNIEKCFIILMMIITNQYQSKVLSMKTTNIMKVEVIKAKNYRQNNTLT